MTSKPEGCTKAFITCKSTRTAEGEAGTCKHVNDVTMHPRVVSQ